MEASPVRFGFLWEDSVQHLSEVGAVLNLLVTLRSDQGKQVLTENWMLS